MNNDNFGFCDVTGMYDTQDIAMNKYKSALSYLWILFFLPLVLSPNSLFAKFHANQGLVLFLVITISSALQRIFSGFFIVNLVFSILSIVFSVLEILGIVFALSGKAIEFPIIGNIKLIK